MTTDDADAKDRAPVEKGTGVTPAERYLKRLCDRTFLSLWSYPGVFRNQGGGKEVCDLLVVFRDHIIIFSDKDCAFPKTGDIKKDWNRWYKRAIEQSAHQIWGAERWMKEHPDRLFLDPACQRAFPIELPDPARAVFHRIVVAHSSAARCRQEMNGGSGGLMLVSSVFGDMHYAGKPHQGIPFWVGQVDPTRGFVHVLDDTSLDVVLRTLDTVSDFISYLEKKERFLTGAASVFAAGEEDLLAFYLKRLNADGVHDFVVDGAYDLVSIGEGEWEEFQGNSHRLAQIAADKVSYTWDALIETFSYHILNGTQHYASPGGVESGERLLRAMASESRFRRRMLSQALLDLMRKPVPKDHRAVRVYKALKPGYPYYVFLLLGHPDYASYEDYRDVRCKLLEAYCMAAKLRFPEAEDIVGIATEPGTGDARSEDAVYLDARHWTAELEQEAHSLQNQLGLLKDTKTFLTSDKEYQSSPPHVRPLTGMKGRDRNRPCPCGSGLKLKKCCGGS